MTDEELIELSESLRKEITELVTNRIMETDMPLIESLALIMSLYARLVTDTILITSASVGASQRKTTKKACEMISANVKILAKHSVFKEISKVLEN